MLTKYTGKNKRGKNKSFITLRGVIETLKKITWRAKIDIINPHEIDIYVMAKKIRDVELLSKKLGIVGVNYQVKTLGYFECFFNRFKIIRFS